MPILAVAQGNGDNKGGGSGGNGKKSNAIIIYQGDDSETPSRAERDYLNAFTNINSLARIFLNKDLTDEEFKTRMAELEKVSAIVGKYKFENSASFLIGISENILERIATLTQNKEYDPVFLNRTLQVVRTLMMGGHSSQNKSDSIYNFRDAERFKVMRENLEDYSNFAFKRIGNEKVGTEFKLMLEALSSLEKVAAANPYSRIPLLAHPTVKNKIANFEQGTEFSKKRENKPVQGSEISTKSKAEIFKAVLAQVAIGQEPLRERIVDFLIESESDLQPKKPKKLWMAGLPGTGKDTYVEALARALHGADPEASKHHIFKVPTIRSKAELWELLGSSTGYIGSSSTVPPFVRFAVEHSAGRYVIDVDPNDKNEKEFVRESTPEERLKIGKQKNGIVFINDFHNFDGSSSNGFFLEFLETGKIPINSPGPGLSTIYVPELLPVFASNHGLELLRPSKPKSGKAPSYEEVHSRYERILQNKVPLRKSILDRNKTRAGQVPNGLTPLSPELMDRFSDDELIPMGPFSQEEYVQICELRSKQLLDRINKDSNVYNRNVLSLDEDAVRFIAENTYEADEGARKLLGTLERFIQSELLSILKTGEVPHNTQKRDVSISFEKDNEGTVRALFKFEASEEHDEITLSRVVRPAEKTTNFLNVESREKLSDFEKSFSENYFGGEHILKLIKRAISGSEAERSRQGSSSKARRFYFDGLSSTGKTQAAKEIQRHFFGDADDLEVIDFNNVTHRQQLVERIYGIPNGEPSEFMKAYDSKGGKLVILLDEIGNIKDPDILVPLYALLDEAKPRFNDGEARSMSQVIIIMTGNATEGIYKGIPRDIPRNVQWRAMKEIYQKFASNTAAVRARLELQFRQAFLNRIGAAGTIIFGPLDDKALRELIQFKTKKLLKRINESLVKNNNSLYIDSSETLTRMAADFEEYIFNIWEQGRSVDNFFEQLEGELLVSIQELAPREGAEVLLEYKGIEKGKLDTTNFHALSSIYGLSYLDDQTVQHKTVILESSKLAHESQRNKAAYLQTAVHEAGHSVAMSALMGEYDQSKRISIVPGVADIGSEFIYYAGVAESLRNKQLELTKNALISSMAVLIAGGEAQRLVNRGNITSGGQSNDLHRVNKLAKQLIIDFHLLDDDSFLGRTQEQTLDEYIKSLSDKQREKLENETVKLISEARALARNALLLNFDHLYALTKELAIKGDMGSEDIEAVHKKLSGIRNYWEISRTKNLLTKVFQKNVWGAWLSTWLPSPRSIELKTVSSFQKLFEGVEIADPEKMMIAERTRAAEKVPQPDVESAVDVKDKNPRIESLLSAAKGRAQAGSCLAKLQSPTL